MSFITFDLWLPSFRTHSNPTLSSRVNCQNYIIPALEAPLECSLDAGLINTKESHKASVCLSVNFTMKHNVFCHQIAGHFMTMDSIDTRRLASKYLPQTLNEIFFNKSKTKYFQAYHQVSVIKYQHAGARWPRYNYCCPLYFVIYIVASEEMTTSPGPILNPIPNSN